MLVILLPIGAALVIAAMLIAPLGLYDVARTLLVGSAAFLVIGPVVGWRSLLIALLAPPPGSTRLAAVFRLWLGGSLILGSILTLMKGGFDYTPTRPGPSPWAGFLLADLSISMLVSFGVWGAIAPALSGDTAIRGALITGCVLSVFVAGIAYLVVIS